MGTGGGSRKVRVAGEDLRFLADNRGAQYAHIPDGAVVVVGILAHDFLNDIHALGHFAEHRVLPVEPRCAAREAVGSCLLIGQLDPAVGQRVEPLLHLRKVVARERAPPDYVELAGAGALLRILVVALAGGGQYAAAVVDVGQPELGRQRVVQVALAQLCAGCGMAAERVAGLNHEVADDPVEEQRVVELVAHQIQEIVAVAGCLVIECQPDVALGGL